MRSTFLHGLLWPGLLIVALAALGVTGCGSDSPARDLGTRAVVIGIDGADWKLIDELAAEGGMPNLMVLRERGSWGKIETLTDIPLSPVIWTSVATGKTATKHGISWFMVDQADGTRVPVRSHNRTTKAMWNILAEHGRRVSVIGWWATYPAEEVGKGTIVSDALGFHGFGSTAKGGDDGRKTYPSGLFDTVDALVPAEQQISADFVSRFVHITPEEYREEMFDPGRFPQRNPLNPIHLFQEYAVTAQGYTAIAKKLLQRPYDLFLLYYEQVDSFSHLFMKYDPPKLEWIDEEGFDRYKDIVREWYGYQDELLGEVLAEIDLDETAVFILSDHGFKSGDRRIRSEETVDTQRAHLDHEIHGIFLAAGPHIRQGVEVTGGSVLDLTPTVFHYLGFPVAKDMDGKVLEALFEPDFMTRNPIRYLTTYEETTERRRQQVAATEDYSEEDAAENLEALEALGYISGSSKTASGEGGEAGGGESSPEMHNNMGRVHLRNGDNDKARTEFQKALRLDPDNAEALLNLAAIQGVEGRTAEAEHLVKRALQVDPNSVAALSQLAELERDLGRVDEAIRLFEEALAINDSLPFLFLGYGDVLQRAGRYDEALEAFNMVQQLEPDSFKARYNRGVTLTMQGRLDEAEAEYEEALELDAKNMEAGKALNNLGDIHLRRNQVDEAIGFFERAVKASPFHFESRYNLAMLYLESERVEEAVELLEAAAAIEPNHELVTTRLGMAYMRLGRNEDAYKSFLLVRRLYARNWAAPLGLALLHASVEQENEARRFLDEALRLGGDAARAQVGAYPILVELLDG